VNQSEYASAEPESVGPAPGPEPAAPPVPETADQPAVPAADVPKAVTRRKRLVLLARTTLIMLFIAGLVMLGLGAASLILADPPETEGWLRFIFGRVFGVVAISLAAVLGIPSAVGLWAMAGAREPDAVPALGELPRRILAGVAAVTIAVTAIVLLVTGSAATILNLGLLGIVGLASFGLAGATSFSPHRLRAIASGVALVLVSLGSLWVLVNAFVRPVGG
jgi:hypothetical protein